MIKKEKCTNCIHKEVCSIYDFAKKHNETSSIKITPYSMADICKHYLKQHKANPLVDRDIQVCENTNIKIGKTKANPLVDRDIK